MSIAVVRLYRQHDMDLITLFFDENVRLCKLMKRTLVNYVNGDDVEMLSFDEPSKTEGYVPKCIRMHIRLNEANEREKAVIDFLASMKPGFRCSFIKALFRNSCAYIPMVGYTTGSEFLTRKLKSIPTVKEDIEVVKATEPIQTIPVTEVLEPLTTSEERNKRTSKASPTEPDEFTSLGYDDEESARSFTSDDFEEQSNDEEDDMNSESKVKAYLPKRADEVLDEAKKTVSMDNSSLDDMFDRFNLLG